MAKEPLDIAGTVEVIARLGDVAQDVVLIGGQALNFWAEQFASRVPALRDEGPYTSKDIDLCGTQEQLRQCAQALGGRAEYQSTDARSLCIGIVHYLDECRVERDLDFLSKPYGLEAESVWDMSFPATVTARGSRKVVIRIMHPLHCLISRVANVGGLPKYQTDHGVRQLKASILCMRGFLQALLDEGNARAVKKLNEKVFKFSRDSPYAQKVFELYRIESFDAVLHDDHRLPAMFLATRYPQMLGSVKQRRAHVGTESP